MKKLFAIALLSISQLAYAFDYTLSICSIFQNEAPYMQEWLTYHHKKGVEHFYLYNNNSIDNYKEKLEPWIKQGIVELIEWPSAHDDNPSFNYPFVIQISAYNDAIQHSKGVTKWLAIIDLDEFIVTPLTDTITELLEGYYSSVSGLCVNWQCYGTSHVTKCHEKDGNFYILNQLIYKMKWDDEWNKNSKSIVQPDHVAYCPNPHYCIYNGMHFAIDSIGNRTDVCCTSVNIDKIRINHYWTRDLYYLYNFKIPRYDRWGVTLEGVIQHANKMNYEYDPIISEE